MKKLLLLILAFLPLSVFAWADTDRICADSNEYGKQLTMISVQYPGRGVSVSDVWKEYNYSWSGDVLYYVVNVDTKKEWDYSGQTERAELYSYNCVTKKPKLLTKIPVNAQCEFYTIDTINRASLNQNIVMRRFLCGADAGITTWVTVYSLIAKKKWFTLNNTEELLPASDISGFVDGKWAWYLYFESSGLGPSDWYSDPDSSVLYRIDKITKKITKL